MSSTPVLLDNAEKTPQPSASSFDQIKDKILPALLAGALGLLLLYAEGAVQVPQMHNATHDARHSAGFPCH